MSATARLPVTALPTSRLAWMRERGIGASILIAALSTAFGVFLVQATAYIGAFLLADPLIGDSGTLALVVGILSVLLTGVALFVASIVTANTFATIVAGRTRRIALMRLIGASARAQRAEVTHQGVVVGLVGAGLGMLLGLAVSWAGVTAAATLLPGSPADFTLATPAIALPAAGVVLTTWLAARVGSRRVLTVTPLQALGGSVDRTHEEVSRRRGSHWAALTTLFIGLGVLALGIVVGLATPLGVVIAFFGGLLSFTGLVLAAPVLMPPVLRVVGRMLGRGATARLAAENALRYPERSSRMAIGVVMGVTLVTMFAVAMESVKPLMAAASGGELLPELEALMDGFTGIMMALVAVSAVIAAVGLVNLLTIGVVQRQRELGLLRAIGLSRGQVRTMVLFEAAHITIAATVLGLLLGTAYGWAGAQSLMGSLRWDLDVPPAGLIAPMVPWGPVVIIVAATAVLTLVAAAVPTRLATRVTPVEALAAA